MWYRNLYFLRCVVRPGAVSPGLFASLVSDGPAWHGDYHTNYNIQSTFWPVYSSNHPELSEPYDRLIVDYLPRARWLCKELFGFEGAYIPHVLFAYEPPPEACQGPTRRQYIHHVWGWTLGVAGFSVQPVWWHYKYEPSREFLEQVAYPVVRDIADFQANFIDRMRTDRRRQDRAGAHRVAGALGLDEAVRTKSQRHVLPGHVPLHVRSGDRGRADARARRRARWPAGRRP